MEKKRQHTDTGLQEAYRASYLVAGFIRSTLTEEERDELDDWILADKANMHLFGELTNEKNVEKALADFDKIQTEAGLAAVKRKQSFKKVRKPIALYKYAIAAAVILFIGLTIVLIQFSRQLNKHKDSIAGTTDILPASNYATLTLENGQTIQLAPVGDTIINQQINVSNKGEIVYAAGQPEQQALYHTLSIPRKAHYKLVLPDGTKVWINAASSIRFPLSFTGNERKVYVTGETFFEVAKDASRPFRVIIGEMTVEATGTQFNINAYPNEPGITATLIEGAVKVTSGQQVDNLVPGEQIQWQTGIVKKTTLETGDIMAWRNNQFKFHNTSLDVIMRQVERWYDATVVFDDKIDIHLNATIERDVPVSKLLQLLQATNEVKFTVNDNKITVSK